MSDKKKNVKRTVRTLAARDLMKATGGAAGYTGTKFPGTLGFVPTKPSPKFPPGALGMMPHGPTHNPRRPVLGFFPKRPTLGLIPSK